MNTTEQNSLYFYLKVAISRELKTMIHAKISIHFCGDTLIINFESAYHLLFVYTEYDVYTKAMQGKSAYQFAKDAYKQFRKFVNSQFFK